MFTSNRKPTAPTRAAKLDEYTRLRGLVRQRHSIASDAQVRRFAALHDELFASRQRAQAELDDWNTVGNRFQQPGRQS